MTVGTVRSAQEGDRQAFERLVAGRIDRLYATAALILHDRTLAEDAVQETLIRAWKSLRGLRDADRFDAWLRQVLVHACIDAARSARHTRQEHELPMELPANDDLEAAVERRDLVARAFAQLSADHRAAFVLRHYLGHSVPEIADALRIPLGTAKSRLHYAEQAMARAMDADGRWATEGETA
jgi:RNA polymerase sigma-70 factor (ECF subfamily)